MLWVRPIDCALEVLWLEFINIDFECACAGRGIVWRVIDEFLVGGGMVFHAGMVSAVIFVVGVEDEYSCIILVEEVPDNVVEKVGFSSACCSRDKDVVCECLFGIDGELCVEDVCAATYVAEGECAWWCSKEEKVFFSDAVYCCKDWGKLFARACSAVSDCGYAFESGEDVVTEVFVHEL